MKITSLLRYALCALLLSFFAGCMIRPPVSESSGPAPAKGDDKDKKDAQPENGSPKDVANKMDVGKKVFQGLGDATKGVEAAVGGKLPDVTGPMGAAADSFKAVGVAAKTVDSYEKGGVNGAVETIAVEGCKHVISKYVTSAAVTFVGTGLAAVGLPTAAVAIGTVATGFVTRLAVGAAVDAAGPYVNLAAKTVGNGITSAATSVGNGITDTLADNGMDHVEGMANGTPTLRDYDTETKIRQDQADRDAAQQCEDADRDAYKANAALNEAINNASKNMNNTRMQAIPTCTSHGGH